MPWRRQWRRRRASSTRTAPRTAAVDHCMPRVVSRTRAPVVRPQAARPSQPIDSTLPAQAREQEGPDGDLQPPVVALGARPEEPRGGQGDDRQGDHRGDGHRQADGQPRVAHEAHDAGRSRAEEEEGDEDAHRRQGRGEDGHAHLAGAADGRLHGAGAFLLAAPEDRLEGDHRRVDEHAHGEHEPHHGDHVEGDRRLEELAGHVRSR